MSSSLYIILYSDFYTERFLSYKTSVSLREYVNHKWSTLNFKNVLFLTIKNYSSIISTISMLSQLRVSVRFLVSQEVSRITPVSPILESETLVSLSLCLKSAIGWDTGTRLIERFEGQGIIFYVYYTKPRHRGPVGWGFE